MPLPVNLTGALAATLAPDFSTAQWTNVTRQFLDELLKKVRELDVRVTALEPAPGVRKVTGITPLAQTAQTILNFFPPSGTPAQQAYSFLVPLDWQAGTDLTWYYDLRAETTGGTVVLNVGVTRERPDEAPVTIVATSAVSWTPLTTNLFRSSATIPGTSLQPGDRLVLALYRLSNDALDTNTGNVFLLGQDIVYTGIV